MILQLNCGIDSRSEYLQAGNHGIRDTVKKANEYFDHVKQTSDATIDSRLLVSAADLSYKKTTQLSMGDATAGIDVDEFVSKCITFMRHGPEDSHAMLTSSTQRFRPRAAGRSQVDPEAGSDEEDEGDAMNWDWLGRSACFQHNARPSVSGFLLGPLSVQKRTRQQTQRKARERIDPSQAVRPQELQEEDLDRQETSNLTTMCSKINKLLATTQEQRMDIVDRILRQMEDPSDEVIHEVMDKYDIADDGGIPLFLFCINPRSFGQSVENLFYVSFLVRDGTVGISFDSRELPTLRKFPLYHLKLDLSANILTLDPTKPYAPIEAQKKGIQKHQAVFSLDFDTWQAIIDLYDRKDCIIPHRQEEQQTRRGWYG